jgi:RNA polymerase sigma factor for flagellar operon FliA
VKDSIKNKLDVVPVNMDTWKKFWPLREIVRASAEADNEIPDSVQREWSEMRNHLVAFYYYLVINTAETMHKKIVEVQPEALASFGVDGLYDAVDGYGAVDPVTKTWAGIDPKTFRPVKFETYVVYRIKGSILDGIRREDWVPRLVRSRAKKLVREREELEARLGREVNDDEMAAQLGITPDEYKSFTQSASLRSIQSLNTTYQAGRSGMAPSNEDMTLLDSIHDPTTPEPLDIMLQEELTSKLFGNTFTPLELKIIHAYYYENRSMKEIAVKIGMSESRVSQINSEIIKRLRDKIKRNPEFFGPKVVQMLDEAESKGTKTIRAKR